jgi:hypothetical protein
VNGSAWFYYSTWLFIAMVFGYLVFADQKVSELHHRIVEVRQAQEREWAQASGQRIKLQEDLAALSGKLTVSPADVMEQVRAIKTMIDDPGNSTNAAIFERWHTLQHQKAKVKAPPTERSPSWSTQTR